MIVGPRADVERSVAGIGTGAHRCCKTLWFNIHHEGLAFLALALLPAPRCRARQPEFEPSAPRSPHQNSLPGWSMQQAMQSRGRSPLGRSLGPLYYPQRTLVSCCRRTEEPSNLCCRTQKGTERRPSATGQRRGPAGHSDKAGGRGTCGRRGQMWPDSTVASLSAAASRRRRTRTSITPVELELIVPQVRT